MKLEGKKTRKKLKYKEKLWNRKKKKNTKEIEIGKKLLKQEEKEKDERNWNRTKYNETGRKNMKEIKIGKK